jgi:2-phosphosulfolactate phosphatase
VAHTPSCLVAEVAERLPPDHAGSATMPPPADPEQAAARAEIRRILENAVDALPSEFRAVFMMIAMPISARQAESVLHAIISPSMRTPSQSNIISPAVMVDLPWNVTAIDLPRSRRQYPGLTNYGCGMQVTISSLLDGAKQASGAVAIIDVFRAFTTAAVAFANGASRIIMVGSVDEALSLRDIGLAQVCMGEVRGRAPPGFDFGNSPFEISDIDFRGKAIAQRTGAGTQGIVAAKRADYLYAASLVTAKATAESLRSHGTELVSLVALGNNAVTRTDEDEACALHLRNILQGRSGNAEAVRQVIRAGSEIARFHDPLDPHHPRDLDIALDIDRFDFAVRVKIEDARPVARVERCA